MLVVTRSAAKAAGATRYFTGKACKHGHVVERMVSNGACMACFRSRNARWKNNNREKEAIRKSQWAKNNPEKIRKNSTKWRVENREKHAANQRSYRLKNLEKEIARQARWLASNKDKMAAINADWYQGNRLKVSARDARRRARKLNATPPWNAQFTDFVMEEASDLAGRREAMTGFAWHVDHMIPLQAKSCCGLHTWSNLQVIPNHMNLKKNNRMIWTLPGEWVLSAIL